jgi:hypothetical protein
VNVTGISTKEIDKFILTVRDKSFLYVGYLDGERKKNLLVGRVRWVEPGSENTLLTRSELV